MVGTKKSLGQHWLKNRKILEEIADLGASQVADGPEICVEIGPGLGTLTSSLLKRFKRVIAVEYDARLAKNLPGSFPGTNLEVVHGDFLTVDLGELTNYQPYVTTGNIPYYITSPIIEKILAAKHRPERAVLLMQKEVTERVLAIKGNTPLSILVTNWAEVEAGPVVKAEEFEPAPKVDSQVVVLKLRKHPLWQGETEELETLLRIAFAAPRKKLMNNLQIKMGKERAQQILEIAGVERDKRPGDLDIFDFQRLKEAINKTAK